MQHSDPDAAREAAKKAGKENLVCYFSLRRFFAGEQLIFFLLCERQSTAELQKEGYLMTEKQWMARIVSSVEAGLSQIVDGR